ncbi:PAS domain-containing protein, partial [Clostridium perfringens]|uniref:PAS domain-containing protein n=1 Tax=Clostridium perfringens TaxID=1502 RepID=UPI0038FCFDCD
MNINRDDFIGKKSYDLIRKIDFKEQLCKGQLKLDEKFNFNGNNFIMNKIPISVDENIIGAVGVFQDIKIYEHLIGITSNVLSLDILNTIMDTTKECVVVVDKDGIITMMSKCYKEFLGYDNPEGKSVEDIIDNTRLPKILKSGNIENGD